jgi:hypothetical protein
MKKLASLARLTWSIIAVIAFWPNPVFCQSLIHVGSYDSLGYATAVISHGNYAYVGDNIFGLVIIDISNPAAPTAVGRYDTPLWIYDMDLRGDTVYMAAGNSEPYSGALYIVDVTDKQNPYLLGSLSYSWEVVSIEVVPAPGPMYAFISTQGQLKIIDVSNPAAPLEISNLDLYAFDMFFHSPNLYVASGQDGLQVVDVSDGYTPQLIVNCDTPGIAQGVALKRGQNSFTFVADGYLGMQVIQIIDPSNPTLIGNLETPDIANKIVGGGYFVYIALYDSGLVVVDVGVPENPTPYAFTDTPLSAWDICLTDARMIAVVGGESIDIYRLDPVGCDYIPGDINGNGSPNGIDVTFAVSYFKGGAFPPQEGDCGYPVGPCPLPSPFYAAGDVNGNCAFNGVDITFLVAYLRGMQQRFFFCPICPPSN